MPLAITNSTGAAISTAPHRCSLRDHLFTALTAGFRLMASPFGERAPVGRLEARLMLNSSRTASARYPPPPPAAEPSAEPAPPSPPPSPVPPPPCDRPQAASPESPATAPTPAPR